MASLNVPSPDSVTISSSLANAANTDRYAKPNISTTIAIQSRVDTVGIRAMDRIPTAASRKILVRGVLALPTALPGPGMNSTMAPPMRIETPATSSASGIPTNSAISPLANAPPALTALNPTEWSDMAFIRVSGGTTSVISPCLAGISKEFTTPPTATSTKIGHGLEVQLAATNAISRTAAPLMNAVTGKILLRGNLSATAPPIGAAMMAGALRRPKVAAERSTESVHTNTSQPTTSISAHVPRPMKLEPSQRVRYAGLAKASNVLGVLALTLPPPAGSCS